MKVTERKPVSHPGFVIRTFVQFPIIRIEIVPKTEFVRPKKLKCPKMQCNELDSLSLPECAPCRIPTRQKKRVCEGVYNKEMAHQHERRCMRLVRVSSHPRIHHGDRSDAVPQPGVRSRCHFQGRHQNCSYLLVLAYVGMV